MLIPADAARYRAAAARLRLFRDTATAAGTPARAAALIAALREQHYRRPRLQAEFDRAGL